MEAKQHFRFKRRNKSKNQTSRAKYALQARMKAEMEASAQILNNK
jgi:hypothetical protein